MVITDLIGYSGPGEGRVYRFRRTLWVRDDGKFKETAMGDAADAILNGDDCELCGEYLGSGDGYPRKCKGCKQRAKI